MYGTPNVECPKCQYKWQTTSKLANVTCPSCNAKVKNPHATYKRKEQQAASI